MKVLTTFVVLSVFLFSARSTDPNGDGLACAEKCGRRIFAVAPMAQLEDCLISDCGLKNTSSSNGLPFDCIAICAKRSLSVTPAIDFGECIQSDCGLHNSF